AEEAERGLHEVVAVHSLADHEVVAGLAGAELEIVGELQRGEQGADLVQAVGAARADLEHEVHLRGRALANHEEASCRASLVKSEGLRRSARASAGWPICSSAARARSRMSAGAPGASASEPGSALRRWAKAACTRSTSSREGGGAVRRRTTSADSTLGTGW